MTKIGITLHPTSSPDRAELDLLAAQIVNGVTAAGGEPVLIAPDLDDDTLYAHFSSIDGLILSGGGDVDPTLYGATPISQINGVDAQRDRTEVILARWALTEGKPLLGICRGLQLLNVVCGGALYQDVSEHKGALNHAYYPDFPHDFLAHSVEFAPGSRLAAILGETSAQVNSLHHQACCAVAPVLSVVALAPDGIVEALEVPNHPFTLAVQWHPEALPDAAESKALFSALITASALPITRV